MSQRETWALLEKTDGLKDVLCMLSHTLSEYMTFKVVDKQNLFPSRLHLSLFSTGQFLLGHFNSRRDTSPLGHGESPEHQDELLH